jgi:hypothetical protein
MSDMSEVQEYAPEEQALRKHCVLSSIQSWV